MAGNQLQQEQQQPQQLLHKAHDVLVRLNLSTVSVFSKDL